MIKNIYHGEFFFGKNKFFKIIREFPDAKWEVIKSKSINPNQHKLDMKLYGSKNLNGKKFKLESMYKFTLILDNGLIKQSNIENNLTTIRSDDNQIDIKISIPDKVLTGSKYDIDIVYTHWAGDSNQDHIATFKATMAAARYVPNVFCYEQIPLPRHTENEMNINYYKKL